MDYSPRNTNDNLCDFIFIGSNSYLGDSHDFHGTHESFDAHQQHIENTLDVAHIVVVYAYMHGGITISTTPFTCRWDSGKLGWAVITKEALRRKYNRKRVTKQLIELAIPEIEKEVQELDIYIN
jgi:hypothetical protein